jgi:F0F1-type ATP synthase assembly protein I
MFLEVKSRPIRIALRWQSIATVALTLAASFFWGLHGAVSTALGGIITLTAGWFYGWMVTRRRPKSAGDALRTMFRAEASKVILIIVQLWLVLANYKEIVHAGFFGAFVITVVVSTMAIAIPDAEKNRSTD